MGHKKVDRTNAYFEEQAVELCHTEAMVQVWLLGVRDNVNDGLLIPYENEDDKILV